MERKNAWALAICLAIPLSAGAVSGLATMSGLGNWYAGLSKPPFNPPANLLIWISIVLMILSFRKIRLAAAWLQVPYLLWVSFAALLNAAIWKLN